MARLWVVFLALAFLWGCGGDAKETASTPQKTASQGSGTPLGTWYLYAGSETGYRTENLDKEVTILVLEDSTYTLTLMQPHIQVNFVEKGRVEYDVRNAQMKFSVFSSAGVDFGGAEPRKLVDVEQVVPWQRDPGTVYLMNWRTEMQFDDQAEVDREVMVLLAEDHENSFFVRLQNPGATIPTLDVDMKGKAK